MESTFLPEQKKQLASWVDQRDSILADIAILKPQKEALSADIRTLAASRTDISDKIQQSIGKLLVLDKQEDVRAGLTKKENAELTAQKAVLQTEISNLKLQIESLNNEKDKMFDDISKLSKVHDTVFNNTSQLEKVIAEIVSICSGNARNVSDILAALENKCKEIISLSTTNVEAHTKVLDEIPKLFVELRKKSIERPIINKHK